ncbi:hypothetical protein P3L10_016824 [Capsicum annuum]
MAKSKHNVYWILSTCNSWNGSNVKRLLLMVSFLDGLELMDGYESGFGLYYVDLGDKNLTRHPKLSQRWYSNFLKGI